MSILSKLEFALDFTSSEKEIAEYILKNSTSILDMSVQELGKRTYTSPATIVRLCRKIGLQGFTDFKIKYSAELQIDKTYDQRINVNYPFSKTDSPQIIIQKLALLNQETINDTLALLDYYQLDKIINEIIKARKIYIFGYGNSLLSALDFQHKMLRIGKDVDLRQTSGEQIFLAHQVKENDFVIFISYSGETSDIINYAKICKLKNAKILAITSLGDNNISKLANYVLNTGSRETIFQKIAPFASTGSIRFILDILFSLIFVQNYDLYLNNKLNQDKKYDLRHPHNSPINNNLK